MLPLRSLARPALLLALALQIWLAPSSAQAAGILAQTGMTKSLLGYGLMILALILGLAVVCRPADRNKVVKQRVKRGEH